MGVGRGEAGEGPAQSRRELHAKGHSLAPLRGQLGAPRDSSSPRMEGVLISWGKIRAQGCTRWKVIQVVLVFSLNQSRGSRRGKASTSKKHSGGRNGLSQGWLAGDG